MRKQSFIILAVVVACVAAMSAAAAAQTARQNRTGQSTTRAATPASRQTPAAQASPTPGSVVVNTSPAVQPAESCGCDTNLPNVLAVVNGTRITPQDFSEQMQQRVRQLHQRVIDARRSELDLQINSILLEAEAKKRGISTTRLIETEIVGKVQPATDAEAQAFYNQNKASISEDFSKIRTNIIDYLTEQRQRGEAQKFAERLRTASLVKVLVPVATPPATPADRARLLATVNERRITSGDIEDSLRPLIYSVQEEVYNLRRNEVELKINDILLTAEAQKRNVTTQALLTAEVASKIPTVTDADAQKFYDENKDRINGDFAQVKAQILQYLQEREANRMESQFAEQLRRGAAINTFLTPPEPPVYDIATDDQPSKGNNTAAVTIVEFTDFQCPSCAKTHPIINRLVTEYADRVKLVVRDFPLPNHANAFKAAEAAEAAREQGKYWEYVALLFENQTALEVDKLKAYATQVGLDRQKFDAALDGGRFAEKVQRDISDGTRAGVNATPTFYINGRKADDISYESLKASIEAALKARTRD